MPDATPGLQCCLSCRRTLTDPALHDRLEKPILGSIRIGYPEWESTVGRKCAPCVAPYRKLLGDSLTCDFHTLTVCLLSGLALSAWEAGLTSVPFANNPIRETYVSAFALTLLINISLFAATFLLVAFLPRKAAAHGDALLGGY